VLGLSAAVRTPDRRPADADQAPAARAALADADLSGTGVTRTGRCERDLGQRPSGRSALPRQATGSECDSVLRAPCWSPRETGRAVSVPAASGPGAERDVRHGGTLQPVPVRPVPARSIGDVPVAASVAAVHPYSPPLLVSQAQLHGPLELSVVRRAWQRRSRSRCAGAGPQPSQPAGLARHGWTERV
jgi:hypothetical protein